ncbi:MAG: hypothetical protein P4M01_10510 [Acidobacteriota bacterium]|nr:hypothetical protein [Acidobacteriota bacterium]
MKKFLFVLLLAAATTAAQAQAAPAGQQQPSDQQKHVIQDPAEGNAYMAAANAATPQDKAQMMESFLQTYPSSVAKEDALDFLLKTYQQMNNGAKVKDAAQRMLQVNPTNVTALVVITYLDHNASQQNSPDALSLLAEAGQYGARCLEALKTAPKPDGATDEQWNTNKNSFALICESAVGHAALQSKDYATAQTNLKIVVAATPNDVTAIYWLALSYLTPKPPVVDGLFWIAKAANAAPAVLPYAKNQYTRYHGGVDGFDELLAAAKAEATIPAGFTVAPAPSPADQAADMMKKDTADKLSFAEWQFILANGKKDDTEKVWTAIKGKPFRLVASVIEATKDTLKLAGSSDDIDAKKSDLTLKLKEPLAAGRIPQPGTQVTIQGTPADYTSEGDNFNMNFSDGEVLAGLPEAKKPTAAHKTAAHH